MYSFDYFALNFHHVALITHDALKCVNFSINSNNLKINSVLNCFYLVQYQEIILLALLAVYMRKTPFM